MSQRVARRASSLTPPCPGTHTPFYLMSCVCVCTPLPNTNTHSYMHAQAFTETLSFPGMPPPPRVLLKADVSSNSFTSRQTSCPANERAKSVLLFEEMLPLNSEAPAVGKQPLQTEGHVNESVVTPGVAAFLRQKENRLQGFPEKVDIRDIQMGLGAIRGFIHAPTCPL